MSNRLQTAQIQQLDSQHHLHPFTTHQTLRQAPGPRVIVKGDGPYVFDSEGNRILDGMAGLWTTNIGYGSKELAQAAYDQILELPFYNTFFKTTHPPVVELSRKLAELAPANAATFSGPQRRISSSIARAARSPKASGVSPSKDSPYQ